MLQSNKSFGSLVIIPKFLIILLMLILLSSQSLFAQGKGSISGKVTDKTSNEELIGANILVISTSTGASTDIDGTYSIKNLTPGKYSLRFSFISYQSIVVDNINVEAGKDVQINIQLLPTSTELNEVVVTAEALKNTEGSLLNIQKNSLNIVDGMSAELISKNNSSDGTDVLKRMTGVTIADGKYAFVRGVGDRYNNTMLNGSSLPSTDPEKKSFAYDLFPASLIENILTSKTFIPDKPADFSGGLIEINTVEFPSSMIFNVSISSAVNTQTTFKNFQSYNGGKRDFLGIDDGTRNMPTNINGATVNKSNYSSQELQNIGTSFSNNWSLKNSNAPMNGGVKLDFGNKINIGNDVLGYIASISYSNSNETKPIEQASYDFEGERYNYKGFNNSYSVNWGALLNVSYKFSQNQKISLKNVYNQTADDETVTYEGEYKGAQQIRNVTSLRYVERSVQSSQLIGEHYLKLFSGVNVDWNVNYSSSKRNEPDARRYIYARGIDDPSEPFRFLLDQSLATRFYSDLNDQNYGGTINFSLKLFDNPSAPTFKFGYSLNKKDRDFSARIFGFRNIPGGNFSEEDKILQSSVDQIFSAENINPTFIEVIEITQPTDSYTSDQAVNAAYLLTDFKLFESLKIVTGLRYENSLQKLNSKSRTGEALEIENQYNDLFPSLNLTYLINDKINVRLAYSRTIARPEFREMAPFTYFDFVSNELVTGNTNLKRSLITNYDARFEFYPAPKELFAVSVFYKKFMNPIEQILISSSAFEPIRSYENSKDAQNWGVEFEERKSLAFIGTMFENFSLVGNLSLIKSKINLEDRGFQTSSRPLQGQADFILNTGLYYEDFTNGLSASIIYNKVGEKISKVGFGGLGDVIEKPRDQIDISFSKKIFDNLSLKLAVKDLLAQDIKFVQKTPSGDKTSELVKRGQNISAGLSFQF